ncbi:hypothetical protein HMPREF1861_00257 [Corynebacterium kroppenstedtii]|nr:hypothetical protein HMPREF1861_00257 [Corynebacterium kroppenstedtii]
MRNEPSTRERRKSGAFRGRGAELLSDAEATLKQYVRSREVASFSGGSVVDNEGQS